MKKIILFILTFAAVFTFATINVQAAAIYDHEVTFNMNGGDYIHRDIATLGDKLTVGNESINLLMLGDSTAAGVTKWYYSLGGLLADKIDNHTVLYREWDETNNVFGDVMNYQYGDEGDAFALYDGTIGEYLATMDSDELSITGDIDIRAKIKGTPSENGAIVSKWSTADGSSYFLQYYLDADGTTAAMNFYWKDDTLTTLSAASGDFTVPENSPTWVRVTLDVDNGSAGYTVSFDSSTDGETYTNIGSTVTTAGITVINDSSSAVEVGSLAAGTQNNFNGNIYTVEIRDGIDGDMVASPNLDASFPSNVPSIKDLEGNTWVINGGLSVGNGSPGITLINGSIAGASAGTFTSNLLSKMTKTEIDNVFISLGHNYNETDDFVPILDPFIDNIQLYALGAKIALITQNKHFSPRTTAEILAQKVRMDQMMLVAAKDDLVLIDAGAALNTDPDTYIGVDGVHPTEAGQAVFADQVFDTINAGITGNGISTITLLVEDGELINEPDEPTKVGATFIGWYTDENLTNLWDFDNDLTQDNMTLYAKWSDSSTGAYSIITNLDDGLSFFGIAWYWYAIVGVSAFFLFGTKDGKKIRKKIGLK